MTIEGTHSLAKLRCDQFDAKHGNDAVQLIQGWFYFSDGARRETNTLGVLIEPPENPFQRAKLIVAYHEFKLKLAVAAFDHQKKIMKRENYIGTDAELATLAELQKKVQAAKKLYESAVEEQNKHDPSYMTPEQAEAKAKQESILHGMVDDWHKKIEAIEV